MNRALNILIAEDNSDDVFLLQQAFKKAGATSSLQFVADGTEVLSYLKGEGAYGNRKDHPVPDILLLDLNMPKLNGFEVLEWLRKDPQYHCLIVHILTASARDADARRAYALGANSYAIKPSRLDVLIEWIKALHEWHRFTIFPSRPVPVDA